MRRPGPLASAVLCGLVAALVPAGASAETVTVQMTSVDFQPQFVPADLTINPGDTVRWINTDPFLLDHATKSGTGRADPTAGDSYATKNEELCKGGFTGYAESEDGFHWKPVRLRQVELDGSRNNNLISFPLGGEQRIRVFNVFILPGGELAADIHRIKTLAGRRALTTAGVAQLQIVASSDLDEARVAEAAGEILAGMPELLNALHLLNGDDHVQSRP